MIQRNLLNLLLAVACIIAYATVAADSSNQKIVQGRTIFPDWSGTGGNLIPSITPNIFEKTAKEYGRVGLFRPKKCITLALNSGKFEEKEVEEVVWQFSHDYYFPEEKITSHKVDVVAWATFLAVAQVKFEDEPQPKIYADWVKIPTLEPKSDFANGEEPCPE